MAGYWSDPKRYGVWWINDDETVPQGILRIVQASNTMITDVVRDELKELYPDDPAIDQIPVYGQ